MHPPRLVARTMAVTFLTVAVILSVVFVVLTVDVRRRVRGAEIAKLQVSERVFAAQEARHSRDQLATIATLAENPTLKAALDTYIAEQRFMQSSPLEGDLRQTVVREAEKLAALTGADVLAVLDSDGRVFTSAGTSRDRWPVGQAVDLGGAVLPAYQGVALLPTGAFRVSTAALQLTDQNIGTLVLATSLDGNYAQELSVSSLSGIVITVNNRVVARTVPEEVTRELVSSNSETDDTQTLAGEEYTVRTLLATGPAKIYALTSVDAAARPATFDALVALAAIAFGGIVLAAMGSLWLAHTLAGPINQVATDIAIMTTARDFGRKLSLPGTSRELDALTKAFNDLMLGLSTAETQTREAYVGAIHALAAALDARDPYTAGHSERVSSFSVLIATQMSLSEEDISVIRIGALLHDIGKIGVPDEVLRKAGPLTTAEFDQIKRHPGLGARILRKVPFLATQLPIVELHHEQPDGGGYPYGLRGNDIPLAARIVHVADAFDAITSARAYRPSRSAAVAIEEIRRHSGTQFDPAAVAAFCAVFDAPLEKPKTQPLELVSSTG